MPEQGDDERAVQAGHRHRRRAPGALILIAALLALVAAGTAGFGVGERRSTPDSASADAGFARDMRVHHLQAVLLSDLVRDRTTDPVVRYLAYDIASGQQAQAGMMSGWLQQWGLNETDDDLPQMAWMASQAATSATGGHGSGHSGQPSYRLVDGRMPGMAAPTQISRLRELSGRPAEVLWLQLMIEHHRGGVEMAQAASGLVKAPYERRLAETIVQSQTAEIDNLTRLLLARGAQPEGHG